MLEKKTILNKLKWVWICLPAVAIVLVLITSGLPAMGENVLKYKLIKSIGLALLGFSFFIMAGSKLLAGSGTDSYGRPHKETLADMYENKTGVTDIKSIIMLVLGIVLFFLGGSNVVDCVKDMKSGPVRITLESTRVGADNQEELDSDKRLHDLYGVANMELYVFDISTDEVDTNLMRKINYLSPEITVVYYQESKAIIQMQILFAEDDKVVLPYGDRAYDSRSLDKLPEGKGEALEDPETYQEFVEAAAVPTPTPGPFVPMKQEYSGVDLEELNLPEVEAGEDYVAYAQRLAALPAGECFEIVWPGDERYEYDFNQSIVIRKKYELSSEQGVRILYKEDIELIIIFNAGTKAVDEIFARRNLSY